MIELGHGDNLFVRRDLKHAVGRRVNDQRTRPHVLGPELVDNLRARGGFVAQNPTAGAARKLPDDVGGKAVRKDGKRAVEYDAHQLPVPGHGILAGRDFSHAADGTRNRIARGWRRLWCAQRHHAIQTERTQRRHVQRNAAGDMTNRVAPFVAVCTSVGQLADADAVEHDDDHAGEGSGHAGPYWWEK